MALDLGGIAGRASSLWERLKLSPSGVEAGYDARRADELLERWQKTVGGAEALDNRTRWAGWTQTQIKAALGSAPTPHQVPAWCSTLQQISDRARAGFDEAERPAGDPVPFEELLLPAVLAARSRVPSAPTELERTLLYKLSSMAGVALEAEFSRAKPLGEKFLVFIGAGGPPKRDRYNAFVRAHLESGLELVFHKYPVLARLIAQTVDLWVETTSEFLTHVREDLGVLGESDVSALHPGLSDSHRGHRTVIAVTFASGRKLVYKPKGLGVEDAFCSILDWCNERGIEPRFKVPRVWNRGTHGWVEFIEHKPCVDENEVRRHYERAGTLMALLYALGATDCHQENIIASGEHPVLVDAEAVLEPEARFIDASAGPETLSPECRQFFNSVIRTGLLPRSEFSPGDQTSFETGGLASVERQQSLNRVPQLKAMNTDDMCLVYDHVEVTGVQNAPMLNGRLVDSLVYVDEIARGFESAYRFLLNHRVPFASERGPFQKLRRQRIRFIFRPTRVYASVLRQAHDPALLQDGAERSIALDAISRPFMAASQQTYAWPVLEAELSAMERLDVPYFDVAADSTSLDGGLHKFVEGYFTESGFGIASAKIQSLNLEDLELQLSIVRGAFDARKATIAFREARPPNIGQEAAGPRLSRDEAALEAQGIATEISERAIQTAGRPYWLGVSVVQGTPVFQYQLLSENLYEGRCGVALFLAAFDRVKGISENAALIDGALKYVRSLAADPASNQAREFATYAGIGGLGGIPSIAYALVSIGRLMNRTDLIEDALGLASLVTDEMIDRDSILDVMNGSAGLILGILPVYRATADKETLRRAVRAGNRLVQERGSSNGEPQAWLTIASKPLTGFSHGAAGIAYALLNLYEATGDSRYLEAAQEGFAYERAVYSADAGNWPDLRDIETRPFLCSWCHGAAGIGMSRAALPEKLKDFDVTREIEAAVRAVSVESLEDVDHLCCGNFGRIELLLLAGRHDEAVVRAGLLCKRAQSEGGYRLINHLPTKAYNPGLFKGTAGIGYQLLRLAEPSLPSLLTLQCH